MVETLNQLDPRPSKSVFRYYEKLIPLAYTMDPLGIMGLGKKIIFSALGFFKPIPREPTSQCDMRNWATKSCSLACENLMLALSAAGYDSCPMEGYDSARLRKILNLPRGTIPIMVISAGKRAKGGVYGPRLRFDQKEFIQEV
jgi:nitroreductase